MCQGKQGRHDECTEETTTTMAETPFLPQRCSVGKAQERTDRKPTAANAGSYVLFTPLASPAATSSLTGNSRQSRAGKQYSAMDTPFPQGHCAELGPVSVFFSLWTNPRSETDPFSDCFHRDFGEPISLAAPPGLISFVLDEWTASWNMSALGQVKQYAHPMPPVMNALHLFS